MNYDNKSGSVTIPATSVAAGHVTSASLTIPLQNKQDFSQIQINLSTSANDWYTFPTLDIPLNTDFKIATVGSYTGSGLVLTFYVINETGGTLTSPAVTIIANAYLFETPS